MPASPSTAMAAPEHPAQKSQGCGVAVFDRRGQKSEFHSHAGMLQRARVCAGRLGAAGIGPGDRVLICLPTSWDLIHAFLGAILRGALPTLVAPSGALGGAA